MDLYTTVKNFSINQIYSQAVNGLIYYSQKFQVNLAKCPTTLSIILYNYYTVGW